MDERLQRQLGVKAQISLKDRVAWFYWKSKDRFNPDIVAEALVSSSLAVFEFHAMVRVEFSGGKAVLRGLGITLDYEGEVTVDGLYNVEITGYADEEEPLEIWEITEFSKPKIYQDS